jgi:hypothetical protein
VRVPSGLMATLTCAYSIDSGKTYISTNNITGALTNISTNKSDTIFWKSAVDLANEESRTVKCRLTPSDQNGSGVAIETAVFTVDNKAPAFAGLASASWDTNKIRLKWIPVIDISTPVTYSIYRSTSAGSQNFAAPLVVVTDSNAVISNLTPLEKEYFVVRASDALGNKESNTIEKSLKVSPPADFNGDMKVNGQDLAVFALAWKNKNLSVADIGPASGTAPYFIYQSDRKIDLEDLMVFAQMWDWSVDQPNILPKILAKPGLQQEENLTLKPLRQAIVNLTLPELFEAQTMEYDICVDGQKVRIDSIFSSSTTGFMELRNVNAVKGTACAVVTNLQNSGGDASAINYSVSLTALKRLYRDTVQISVNGYDSDAKLKLQLEKLVIINRDQLLPEEFALHQNYPNPFNPTTRVEYELPEAARVTIKIYNMLGQTVCTLVNGEISAGYQSVIWNANVSSGVYFYQMEGVSLVNPSRRFTEVKKMVLMK